MKRFIRFCVGLALALLMGAGSLLGSATRARAQGAYAPSFMRPLDAAANIGGAYRIDIGLAGFGGNAWWWDPVQIRITNDTEDYYEQGYATIVTATEACYVWNSANAPNGTYTISAYGVVNDDSGTLFGLGWSSITVTVANGCAMRHSSGDKLSRCESHASVPMVGGSIHPRETNEDLSVPVTSWQYHGATFPFGLRYTSTSLVDPQSPATPEFSGMADKNGKWSHPFAQWIDLWQDEHGTPRAVWHPYSGCTFDFAKSGSTFTSPDSYHTLTYGGGPVTSPAFPYQGGTSTLVVDYGYFILKDGQQTEYDFNYLPPSGQTHLVWRTAEGTALPHYLLTRIKDRWGRTVNITWSGGSEPRVTAVRDGGNTGLTLNYTNNLLTSVVDPQGRTHTLGYTGVADEHGDTHQKLTSVTVYGPGSPNRTVSAWTFGYANLGNAAYGGTYTGDLVTQKTRPDGLTIAYQYGPVAIAAWWDDWADRVREDDWDGAIAQTYWTDSSEGSAVQKVVTQGWNGGPALTFPGNVSVRYSYAGEDLTGVTDLSTGRTWRSSFDGKHNLLSTRTPLEGGYGQNPLQQFSYLFDGSGHITQMTRRVRQADGTLGDPAETQLNAFNQPTQIRAYARAGSGNPDQITQSQYDGGGALTVGSLTKVIEGYGTTLQQETNTFYDAPDGAWGLPTRSVNAVGATSSFTYDHERGWILSSASPPNLVVPTTHPDYPASVTTTAYNSDGLPSLLTDATGHPVAITYNAAAPGSPNLVTTYTHADGSYRQVTTDAMGRTIQTRDERGILTQWTHNPQGQVKTIRRAAGTADETLTTYYYDDRGDLYAIDPPNGSGGRVTFEYLRYNQDGTLDGTYEGQVTRINYPDGTSELSGYNDAGELSWRRKADGGLITLTRDSQHRVVAVTYPDGPGGSGFTVATTFDEFGRITATTDNTGTTSRTYDALNRLATVTSPSPRKPLAYTYTKDLTLERWITNCTVSGVGAYTWRQDTKGRLSEVLNPFGQDFRQEFDKDGKKTLTVHANGVQEERTYTDRDWLASVLIRQANGSVLDTLNYYYTDGSGVYDPTGHLRREVDLAGRTHAFFYDNRYELTSETHPDFSTAAYGYDLNGNRTSKSVNGVTDFYGVDANNKLLWVNRGSNSAPTSGQTSPYTLFSYDANGSMAHRERRYDGGLLRGYDFLWDGDGRLRQVNEGANTRFTASYDGGGLRTNKWDTWTGQHDYSRSAEGVLFDSSGSTAYTPGFAQRANGVDRFFHADWLGSTRYLSDGSGNSFPSGLRYSAFGERSATGGTDPYDPSDFQFAGGLGYQAEYASASDPGLGLEYVEQRYYDAATARFISPDPIGFDGGLNLYRYAQNNPVGRADPTATSATVDCTAAIVTGAAAGARLGAGRGLLVGAPEGPGGAAVGVSIGAVAGAIIGGALGYATCEAGQAIANTPGGSTGGSTQPGNKRPPPGASSPPPDPPKSIYRAPTGSDIGSLRATGMSSPTSPIDHLHVTPDLDAARRYNAEDPMKYGYGVWSTTVPTSEYDRAEASGLVWYDAYRNETVVDIPFGLASVYPDFFSGWTQYEPGWR